MPSCKKFRGTFKQPFVLSLFKHVSRSFFITGDKFGNLFILIPTAFFLLYVVFGCTNDRTYSSERLLSLCIMQQNLLPPLANFFLSILVNSSVN